MRPSGASMDFSHGLDLNAVLAFMLAGFLKPDWGERSMRLMRSILLRSFGRPQGTLGRLGGVIMARMNADCGTWVTHPLGIVRVE
jgi:hypothetical protein